MKAILVREARFWYRSSLVRDKLGPGRLRALVAESDSGFGAAWIGLYRGLSCECEQPHFKFAKWLPTLGGTKATVRWTKGWWVAPK